MSRVSLAIDLGWLMMLKMSRAQNMDFVHHSQPRNVRLLIFRQVMERVAYGQYRDLLLFLEQLAVNDLLVVDGTAVERMNLEFPKELEPIITLETPTTEVYVATAQRAIQLRNEFLKAEHLPKPMQRLREAMSNQGDNEFWTNADKH